MTVQNVMFTIGAAALLAAVATIPAGASGVAGDPTPITFSRDVALPGITLPAGRYVFQRANPATSADAVLVRNQRGTVQWLGLTHQVERRDPGHTLIQLSETAQGQTPRVLTWFPSGSSVGAAFIY